MLSLDRAVVLVPAFVMGGDKGVCLLIPLLGQVIVGLFKCGPRLVFRGTTIKLLRGEVTGS